MVNTDTSWPYPFLTSFYSLPHYQCNASISLESPSAVSTMTNDGVDAALCDKI